MLPVQKESLLRVEANIAHSERDVEAIDSCVPMQQNGTSLIYVR